EGSVHMWTTEQSLWPLQYQLFHYTTLFRSYVDGADLLGNNNLEQEILNGKARSYGLEVLVRKNTGRLTGWVAYTISRAEQKTIRSEEHTSELQSRENLVCRLLLEKKKSKSA